MKRREFGKEREFMVEELRDILMFLPERLELAGLAGRKRTSWEGEWSLDYTQIRNSKIGSE
jgi:hypothetical protein